MSDYPKHWKDLAKSIKEKSDWRCNKCGRACLSPGDKSITDKPRAYNNPASSEEFLIVCEQSIFKSIP